MNKGNETVECGFRKLGALGPLLEAALEAAAVWVGPLVW